MRVESAGVPQYPEATMNRNPRRGVAIILAVCIPFWVGIYWLVLR